MSLEWNGFSIDKQIELTNIEAENHESFIEITDTGKEFFQLQVGLYNFTGETTEKWIWIGYSALRSSWISASQASSSFPPVFSTTSS